MANLATVVASRKLGLVFVTSMLCLQLCNSLQNGTSVYTVQVYRRISLDIYILSSDLNSENCDPTLTYLVNERKCVSDQELYSGMYIHHPDQRATFYIVHYRMQLRNHSYYHAVHHSDS